MSLSKAQATPQLKDLAKGLLQKSISDFTLPGTGGTEFQLKQKKGKRLVLYFYPKDSTPGCTLEGHEFTHRLSEFKKLNTEVYGISRDSLRSHEKFKAKECYGFELLSDEDEKVCRLFSVIKEKNMYGKKVMGIERSTFLLDESGKCVQEWRGVKAQGHAQQVLDTVKNLKK